MVAAANAESVQSQIQAHFMSRNVVYAILVEGVQQTVSARHGCRLS